MLQRFFRALGVLSVLATLIGVPARVEAAHGTFRVPFDFKVNGKRLPTGLYHVSLADNLLLVRGDGDGVLVLTNALASGQAAAAQLVFHRHGSEYVLQQAWLGQGTGRQLAPAGPERERRRGALRTGAARGFDVVKVPAL